jgi:hypothetical protein
MSGLSKGESVSAAAALLLSLAAAACGKMSDTRGGDVQRPAPPPQQSAPAASQPAAGPAPQQPSTPTSTPTSAPQPAAAARAPAGPAGALAKTDGEYPGVNVAVTELQRGPNTLTLKLVITNGADKDFGFGTKFGETSSDYNSIGGIHLIDGVAKKKYFVQRDAEGACLCSRSIENIPPHGQATLWAKFPAPPDDVQKITVEIPHFIPMEDVPIGR